jgi:hypothetical protein
VDAAPSCLNSFSRYKVTASSAAQGERIHFHTSRISSTYTNKVKRVLLMNVKEDMCADFKLTVAAVAPDGVSGPNPNVHAFSQIKGKVQRRHIYSRNQR